MSTMIAAFSARGMDMPPNTASTSTSVYTAMGRDMWKNNAVSCTKDARLDEYAKSLMTTLGWPIPTAPPMLGPLDDRKDINKGVML
jgi:hypothetical protein